MILAETSDNDQLPYGKIGYETNGEKLGIASIDEETGSTTVNLGMISCDEEKLSFTLDIRIKQYNRRHVVRM